MQVIILAAGLGRRLGELTSNSTVAELTFSGISATMALEPTGSAVLM